MDFARSVQHPVALIGCRTTEISLDCCEYDLAVFTSSDNQIVQVGDYSIELVHFNGPVKNYPIELGEMQMLNDTGKLLSSSSASDVILRKYRKALTAAGRKSLINSLFYQQKMRQAKQPVLAAMWLKLAAYEFIEGMLALSGSRPMPLHELKQLRRADGGRIMEGVEVALECIGIERATRPAVSRSFEAILELKSEDYDHDLFVSKADHLLGRSMLTDCYYYIGRIAAKSLAGKKESFCSQYAKLIQLALDLSNDVLHLEKMQKRLFEVANSNLKT